MSVEKQRFIKIFGLISVFIMFLNLFAVGIIYPLNFVEVNADIVEVDDMASYSENDGTDEIFFIETMIKYEFIIENKGPFSKTLDRYNFRIEPKKKLKTKLRENTFYDNDNFGFMYSVDENLSKIELSYNIGSIDPGGKHPNQLPPPSEILKEIKELLYDAELVIELNNTEMKRVNLLDYKAN